MVIVSAVDPDLLNWSEMFNEELVRSTALDAAAADAGIRKVLAATTAVLNCPHPVTKSVPLAPTVRQVMSRSICHERFVCDAMRVRAALDAQITPLASAPVP